MGGRGYKGSTYSVSKLYFNTTPMTIVTLNLVSYYIISSTMLE